MPDLTSIFEGVTPLTLDVTTAPTPVDTNVDCTDCQSSTHCARSTRLTGCHYVEDAHHCVNCVGVQITPSDFESVSELFYCSNCHGCQHCAGLVNQADREYCYGRDDGTFVQLTPEQWAAALPALRARVAAVAIGTGMADTGGA